MKCPKCGQAEMVEKVYYGMPFLTCPQCGAAGTDGASTLSAPSTDEKAGDASNGGAPENK